MKKRILWFITLPLLVTLFIVASNYLAPLVAQSNSLNPYYFLNWGAPAVFHEEVDNISAGFKLEPWRLIGLQLPAFASVESTNLPGVAQTLPGDDGAPSFQLSVPGPVIIYHTHSSEAFVPTSGEPRSENPDHTVVFLGKLIESRLITEGIEVIHSCKCHDSQYNKSYVESRKTAQEILAATPDASLMIDIHRDGVGKTAEVGWKVTTTEIAGKHAGQIMFVLSSAHENWRQNNRVATDLHNLLEDRYPGLSRGILVRLNSTYNQDLHSGAILVEIGGHWNTLEEATYGAELFAEVLAEYLGGVTWELEKKT